MPFDKLFALMSDRVLLNQVDRGLIKSLFQPVFFARHTRLVQPGGVARWLYFINAGYLRVFAYREGAGKQSVSTGTGGRSSPPKPILARTGQTGAGNTQRRRARIRRFKTISEFHAFVQLPKPQHPLLSVVDVSTVAHLDREKATSIVLDFYSISVKRMRNVQVRYGQHSFDFNEGILSFMAPNQVFSIAVADKNEEVEKSGWVVYIHPDFIWNTPLAKTINQYGFWD
jgi:hypothetical protein